MDDTAHHLRDGWDRMVTVLKRSLRFRKVILITLAAGALASLSLALFRPRSYRSETLIVYREGIRPSSLLGGEGGGETARKLGLKLREMVLSRTRLAQIMKQFDLYPDLRATRGEIDAVDEMRSHIAFVVRDGETFILSFEGPDPKVAQAVAARLADSLIDENSKSRLEQAALTRDFLDAEMQRTDVDLKTKETRLAEFLSQHPEFARESSGSEAGSAIRAEREKRQKGGRPPDPILLALERQAARIEHNLGIASSQHHELAAVEADPRLVANQVAAEGELQAARHDLAEKLTAFTDQHPDVRAARSKVDAADGKLRRATDAVFANGTQKIRRTPDPPEPEHAVSEEDLARLNGEIAAYKAKKRHEETERALAPAADRIVALETDWTRLNREVAEARERHQQLESKKFRAAITASSLESERNAQMVVVDPAFLPMHPQPPGRAVVALGGLALTLVIAFAAALGGALLDDRVHDRTDLERLGIIRILAIIPAGPWYRRRAAVAPERAASTGKRKLTAKWGLQAPVKLPLGVPQGHQPTIWVDAQRSHRAGPNPALCVLSAPQTARAAGFRLLRRRLAREGDPRVIGVTSAQAGDGKTTCAANLALALAEDARVLLIEANLHSPSLAPLFQVNPPACFWVQLEHHREHPIEPWSVVQVTPPTLHLAAMQPEREHPPNLDGRAFAAALTLLRRAGYDYIVLDMPPVLGSPDVNLIEDSVDGLVLTTWAGRSSARALRRAADQLHREKILGVSLLHA